MKKQSVSNYGGGPKKTSVAGPPSRIDSDRDPHISRRESRLPSQAMHHRPSYMIDPQQQQYHHRPSRISLRQSIGGSHRSGIYSNDGTLRQLPLENTYRIGPKEEERFNSTKVEKVLDEFLANYLGGEQYDAQKCSQMALQMSEIIKERVKKMEFRRHKVYCHVVLGQNLGQGMQISSRCLWDSVNDSYASATFSNNSLFAVATVYAVYFE